MSSSSANLERKEELLVVNAKEGRVGREVDMINNKNRPQTTKPFFVIFLLLVSMKHSAQKFHANSGITFGMPGCSMN